MGKVLAAITVSVDGCITGPSVDPGCGLGFGGERLHYWVSGGPHKASARRNCNHNCNQKGS